MAAINLDTAARLDITCRKGDTFSLELDFGQTIPGKAWTMHVRETDTSEGEENIIIEADQPDQITITDFNGVTDSLLTVTISAAIMEDIESGMYVYDLQNIGSSIGTKTYVFGLFKVNEDITAF